MRPVTTAGYDPATITRREGSAAESWPSADVDAPRAAIGGLGDCDGQMPSFRSALMPFTSIGSGREKRARTGHAPVRPGEIARKDVAPGARASAADHDSLSSACTRFDRGEARQLRGQHVRWRSYRSTGGSARVGAPRCPVVREARAGRAADPAREGHVFIVARVAGAGQCATMQGYTVIEMHSCRRRDSERDAHQGRHDLFRILELLTSRRQQARAHPVGAHIARPRSRITISRRGRRRTGNARRA